MGAAFYAPIPPPPPPPHTHALAASARARSFNYQRTERDERKDVYPTIWEAGVRVLVYNGEADACVPWIDNSMWTSSLNFSTSKPWTSWESEGQVGGYVVQYTPPTGGHFDFATVKGAGHMVPR